MIKVGVTGGIGSGKSLICKVFEKIGIPVFYADQEAKKLLDDDPQVKKAMVDCFGENIYDEKGIKKAFLASKIFNNKDALRTVNSIVHPAVRKLFLKWAREKENALLPYVVEEAAILFESGAYKDLDLNILVYAPEKLRIKRVMQRDNLDQQHIKARIKHQMKDEEKIQMADEVIYNDEYQLVIPQILKIHQQLTKK